MQDNIFDVDISPFSPCIYLVDPNDRLFPYGKRNLSADEIFMMFNFGTRFSQETISIWNDIAEAKIHEDEPPFDFLFSTNEHPILQLILSKPSEKHLVPDFNGLSYTLSAMKLENPKLKYKKHPQKSAFYVWIET